MSSRVATATWTFIPVWISTSSMATTLAGSAMATTSVSSPIARDRHELAAAGHVGRQQVDRRHVEAILGEVQEVQAEPLGNGARSLLERDHALVDEELIRRGAGVAGGQHRRLDALARREAQVDDDLGQEAHRAAGVAAGRRHGSRTLVPGLGHQGRGDTVGARGELFAHVFSYRLFAREIKPLSAFPRETRQSVQPVARRSRRRGKCR